MNLKDRLLDDMKTALRQGDKITLGAIRLLRARIVELEKEKRRSLTDEEIQQAAVSALKRHREAAEQFRRGNRLDLAGKEEAEIVVVERYAPQQMSEQELRALVAETIRETGALAPGDFGRVMGVLMPKIKGRADGKVAGEIVRKSLGTS